MEEKYFEILDKINKEKIDITKLYLIDCLSMNKKFNKETIYAQAEFCYDVWLNSNVDLSLSRLAELVQYHWAEIQNDEMFDEDIIEKCVEF